MAIEKEKKFLLKEGYNILDLARQYKSTMSTIRQAYLMLSPGKQLRVRTIDGTSATICYKQCVGGDTRNEYEFPIDVATANQLIASSDATLLKVRASFELFTPDDTYHIDIDSYPSGLKVVEVEYEGDFGVIPEFCGVEAKDIKYSNIAIAIANGPEILH